MKLVFFDVETGGLDPTKHAIIQIAAIAVDRDSFDEVERFEQKILFPESAAEPEALEVNSYDREVWKKEAVYADAAERAFSLFLKRHATRQCVSKRGNAYYTAEGVAHNSEFDMSFLRAWYSRRDAFMPMYPSAFCTVQLAKWVYLKRTDAPENVRLETLAHHFGVWSPDEEYHDAMADVVATIAVAKRLLELLTHFNGKDE